MVSNGKGKEVAEKGSSGKRKRNDSCDDKTGRGRRNRDVLQFFEDVAVEFNDDEDSDGSADLLDDCLNHYEAEPKETSEVGRSKPPPVLPKEEELSGDELEKYLEERYRGGSEYVRYAEDVFEAKGYGDGILVLPTLQDPPMWKVKCKVGRERHTVLCLMQKYVDLESIGTKLQIISAFAVEHIKGFVFVEAARQSDVSKACRQLADVYYSLVTQVPKGEVSQLLAVRKKKCEITAGMWARVKSGTYKGDLAQVVSVNDLRTRATVQLIPRIDLQSMAAKFGGAGTTKKTSVPPPRLISSNDLEEFQPLIQYRHDRDTGKFVEVLDGLMLKDGFLFKKMSIDSLSFWDVNPSEVELQKFSLSTNEKSTNSEWLSELYGEQKKKKNIKNVKVGGKGGGKGGEKGEGPSCSNLQDDFQVHNLVVFGKKNFGMIIGMEKDEYKILIEGSEGPTIITNGTKALKLVESDTRFTALDRRMKTVSLNDTVIVLDGAAMGRQGIVKQVYRGIVFLYDQNELEKDPYFCAKSNMVEKVKRNDDRCQGKGGQDAGPSGLGDFPLSPKSPLSPEKSWQARKNNREPNQRDKEELFSIGQTVRIRIGPLKGYLCRVIAIRFSDITVKLASQQKVLTVKSDHLAEVRGKSFGASSSDDPGSSSIKPFDLLGAEGSTDWIHGSSGTAEVGGWNSGVMSTERSSWPAFPSSSSLLQFGTETSNRSGFAEDSAWQTKIGTDDNLAWGKAVEGKSAADGWGKNSSDGPSHGWGSAKKTDEDPSGSSKNGGSIWGCETLETSGASVRSVDVDTPWTSNKNVNKDQDDWGNSPDPWGKGKKLIEGETKNRGDDAMEITHHDSVEKGQDGNIAGCWGNKGANFKNQVSAGASGSSAWVQKSLETGEDASHEIVVRGSSMDSQDKPIGKGDDPRGKTMDAKDEDASKPASGEWGKATNSGENSDQHGGWGKDKGWKIGAGAGGEDSGWRRQDDLAEDNISSGGEAWGAGKDTGGANQSPGAPGAGENSAWNVEKPGTRRGKCSEEKVSEGNADVSWNKAGSSYQKGSSSLPEDSWGRAANKWGSTESSGSKGWKSQTAVPESQTGGCGGAGEASIQPEEDAAGGWNKGRSTGDDQRGKWGGDWKRSDDGNQNLMDSWSRPNAFGADGVQSWGKSSGNEEEDLGFTGGRGAGGRRGRGTYLGGRDHFGRGRGRSYGQRDFSSSKGCEDGSSRGSSYCGNNDQTSWGNDRYGKNWGSWGGTSGGNNDRENDKGFGGDTDLGGGWNKHKSSDNDGLKDEAWKKQKTSFGDSESSGKEGWGAFPRCENQTSGVHGSSDTNKWTGGGNSSESAGGNGEWKNSTAGTDFQVGGWGRGGGRWGEAQEGNAASGWNKRKNVSGGWGSSLQNDGDITQAQTQDWSKPSWNTSSGNGTWSQSYGSENDQGSDGSRGFGGRRGRGGFRGGRDGRGGRGRGGRSFGRGQYSSWNNESQDGGQSADWRSDRGGSWGKTKGSNDEGGGDYGGEKARSWNTGGSSSWGGSGGKGGSSDQGGGGHGKGGSNEKGGGGWSKGGDGWNKDGGTEQVGSGWSKGGSSDQDGAVWSKGRRSDQDGGGWGKGSRNNDFGGGRWSKVGGNDQGSGGWGKGGGNDQDGGGWGKGGGNDQGNGGWSKGGGNDQGGGWGKEGGNDHGSGGWGKGGSSDQGGSGWAEGGGNDQGSGGWGKGDGNDQGGGGWSKRDGNDQGGRGWGKEGGNDHGSGGWGKGGSSDQGGSGWAEGGGNDQGSGGWGKGDGNDQGGRGWSKRDGNDQGGRGWGKGGSNDRGNTGGGRKVSQSSGSGWGGNSSDANNDQGGGWGKAKGWGISSGSGNLSAAGGNGEQGGGSSWGQTHQGKGRRTSGGNK